MKFNWGTGIFAVYIGFVLLILAAVIFAFTIDVDLVADNYYEKELLHQTEIDKADRASKLTQQINFSQYNDSVILRFPKIFSQNLISGTIFFSRDDNSEKDFFIPVTLDDSLSQVIPTKNLLPGLWRVKIDWRVNSTTFLTQKNLMVN
ncbi:MAG: hypothetical protein CO129_06830 [Ignavibacteriales bacterium CG_4_9_14_3_um_filter_34_10]|nr:MAG: hypothetical protein CO129_06830 [Ignavibacteriales bacterium CG_4_9_14_3_um_filter_34_10]